MYAIRWSVRTSRWLRRFVLLALGRFPVIVAVIAVRMVQAAIDNIIYVVAMPHRFMSAARTMFVVVMFRIVVAASRAVLVGMVFVGMMIFRHLFRCFPRAGEMFSLAAASG